LAYLGQARAYAIAGRATEAEEAYQQFFRMWKDADNGIPLLRQARSEADHLKKSP
jgi:hypothetical protein